jgi:hypothetical protein
MIAKLPPYKRRTPWELARIGLIIGLILTPALAKIALQQKTKVDTLLEYQSTRAEVLARIDAAVTNRDLETLSAIHDRYSDSVQDAEFRKLLDAGLARLTAREARLELAVSKHLDLSRHREEASIFPDPTRPQLPPTSGTQQTLSVLPR